MKRKMRRCIRIDSEIFKLKDNEVIIVHTEEEFNEKCRQNPEKKNIHYSTQSENNQTLLWQKSSGPISKLKKYLIKEDEESIDEEKMLQKNNEKVLIISAEPGMGKSFILDHFTQNSTANNFFIKIELNICKETLSDKNFKLKMSNDSIDFVLKSLLNKTDDQEISLLKNLAKEKRLILMFDGLDEVNDYKEQIIHLIDEINRNDKIKKILITTRTHLRQELEDHFKTFAFNLNDFNDEDQKNFLVKYWHSLNKDLDEEQLVNAADKLISQVKSSLTKNINELIGIPLQTKMLGDIYFGQQINRNSEISFASKITNIADLYHHFVENKIIILYEEKNNLKIEQLSKQFKTLFEMSKNNFYSDHMKLSSLILLENSEKLDLKLTREEILEYGVIVEFTDKTPTFLHQSFAEFFLAKQSFKKLIEQNKEIDKELEKILREKRHFLIRRFLNDLMEKLQFLQEEQNQKNEDFTLEIWNCCRENLLSLLKYFVKQKGVNLKAKNEFLIKATENGHKKIVAYFLEQEIDVNQQNKWGSTSLILASRDGHNEIVQILLEQQNINVNQQNERGETALIWASLNGYIEMVKMLLENKEININQQDQRERTALMWSSMKGHTEIVKILLQNEDINVNQQSKYRETALMMASSNGHKEIVQMLEFRIC
jgi:ankyrin repeat protein